MPAAAWSNAWSPSYGTSTSRSGTACAPSAQCAEESAADVGVMTTLVESRLLAGNEELLAAMREAVSADRIWPVKAYFEAKVAEQHERHLKANDTAYNLEPNVKTGPGGLRDIQTIAWVAKRHFGASSLDELLDARLPVAFRAAQAQAGAVVPVEGAFRPARAHRPARRPPVVRSPDQARAELRLRRRFLHARGRAVHAALLPHRHGRHPAQRIAAAAVPRGHPHRDHAAAAAQPALPGPQRLPRSDQRGDVRAHARRRCSRSSWCCSRTRT